ncbi:MAG TPA: hypothetical protein VGH33_08250 [Isosphaeraceae bacterium]
MSCLYWALLILGLALPFVGVLLYSLQMQRRAVRVQGDAMTGFEESLALQRQALAISEQSLALQHEIRGLLERVASSLEGRG